MTGKRYRQNQILALVEREQASTQREIIEGLRRRGIKVTQSTLSKDLKDLGLAKIPDSEGTFRYQIPERRPAHETRRILIQELTDFLIEFSTAGNILVLKTRSGNAQSVCEAIDIMRWPEVMGSLAGENTIFIVSKTAAEAERLRERISETVAG